MPGPAYHELAASGHEDLARRVAKKLEPRQRPDTGDVEKLLARWEREEGGPDTGWEWLAVTRLWLKAGEADRAERSLALARRAIPGAVYDLDRARVAFLAGRVDEASQAYWRGCEDPDGAAASEYWRDVEPLATPAEEAEWDRLRRLPAGQRDDCALLRRFWHERSLASGMDVDARIAEHFRRLRIALKDYRRRSGKKEPTFSTRLGRPRDAAFDDRGLLYLRIGPPDETATYIAAGCVEPNVTWAYDYPDGRRLFHFTTFGGLDDWWLIDNLGLALRCGTATPPAIGLLPAGAVSNLYQSRSGLDTRYSEIAYRSGGVEQLQQLRRERDWTHADAGFAISEVPGRPAVDLEAPLALEWLQFRADGPDLTRVWLNAAIAAEGLQPERTRGGRLRYRVEAVWTLLGDGGAYRRLTAVHEVTMDGEPGEGESLPLRVAAELPPGRYRYSVVARDARPPGDGGVGKTEGLETRRGSYASAELTVRDLGGRVPLVSDVVVSADSGGAWTPGADVFLRPNPAHTTGADGIAFLYYEIYNLTPGGRVVTRVHLEPTSGDEDEAFDLTYPAEVPPGGGRRMPSALRLDLTDSAPGTYRLVLTVEDRASGRETLPVRTLVTRAPDGPGR